MFAKHSKFFLISVLSCLLILGCEDKSDSEDEKTKVAVEEKSTVTKAVEVKDRDDGIVDVITTDFRIQAPTELKKGWTTFRFSNKGQQVHFVVMYRLVDGKTIDDQRAEVAPAFDPLMQGLRSGELTKEDIGPFLEENIPEWGLQMTWVGGAGLLAPGHNTESTFYIDQSGTYLLECYVKAPNGQWHTLMGMLHQIEVSEQENDAVEPVPNYEVMVSSAGVNAPDKLSAGRHTIKVVIEENPPGFMPYDLNLARIDDETDRKELYHWMDWTNVGGLRAPAPVKFLGGLEHMLAGNYGYVTVDLAPGRYVWISEINAANINKEFVVE